MIMDVTGISLTLLIGPTIPAPAPQFVTEALERVSVTHTDKGPSGFQLEFKADRTSSFLRDFQLLATRVLATGNRVVLMVTIGGRPRVLMDGFITHIELSHSKASGASTISVTGEDVSVKMDMIEVSEGHPGLGHFAIVDAILAKYVRYGVAPIVIPTSSNLASNPLERVPQQNATDRDYINSLAGLHGNVFLVRPGPAPMTNIAYWGPPPRVGVPLATLTVDMGPSTNVESISFSYDGLAPTLFLGLDQDAETETDIPIATLTGDRLPLAAESPLLFNQGLLKTKVVKTPGLTAGDALAYVQGMTDRSLDNVLTAQGEVDTLRYGSIMDVPGLVGVRGCGMSLDGFYYVKSVTHSLSRGAYRQQFSLSREGFGTTTPVVPP
jgi:hypothetical protein